MKKEFVPYEQSLQLKELGFDEPCFTWYWDDIGMYNGLEFGNHNQNSNYVSAPLYQQAFRWFREKHRLYSWITMELGNKSTFCWVLSGEHTSTQYAAYFHTYEEAELACLDKLIEIVKNKYMSDTITLNRRFLVETLENLLTDGFDSSELVHLTNDELVLRIIEAAEFYKSWNE